MTFEIFGLGSSSSSKIQDGENEKSRELRVADKIQTLRLKTPTEFFESFSKVWKSSENSLEFLEIKEHAD